VNANQLAYFAWTYEEEITPWSDGAAIATSAKFVFVSLSILLLLVGACRSLRTGPMNPATISASAIEQPLPDRLRFWAILETWPAQCILLVSSLGVGGGLLDYLLRNPSPNVEPEEWVVTFLHLHDTYEIIPPDGGRSKGLARVATLRKELKRQTSHTYMLHAGNFLSPPVLANGRVQDKRLTGEQIVAVLKAAGVDYFTFGNHDFDLTETEFTERLKELASMDQAGEEGKALFSTNVRACSGQCFPNIPANRLLTIRNPKDGGVLLRIGLIGLTTDRDSARIFYAKVRKPIDAAQEQLRQWQGVSEKPDVVVALTHESLDEALVRAVPGIDLILGGREHDNAHRRALSDGGPEKLLPSIYRADANVRTVYVHQLTFDLRRRRLLRIHSHLKAITDAIAPDPEVSAIVERYARQASAGSDGRQ
jgi:5'-nucleotidase